MSSMPQGQWSAYGTMAADVDRSERATFIRRTYLHLAGAVSLLVVIEAAVFTLVPQESLWRLASLMMGTRWSWLLVIVAFMVVGGVAQSWASSASSRVMQYMGLLLYIAAEAVIFIPLLLITSGATVGITPDKAYPAIAAAGLMTGILFGGLTMGILITRTDLSGWGKYLWLLCLAAIGAIVCSLLFGFNLGVWFNCAVIALLCGCILYQTSNVLHRYRTDQHVAASLALFASVAMLFYYVLMLFGGRRS